MIKSTLLAASAVLLLSAPSFAATSYYLAHKPNSTACQIMQTKPDGKTMMMVGKSAFKSSAAAQTAMKSATGCK
jgi:hypothetical protein